jgi:hypothetical protein
LIGRLRRRSALWVSCNKSDEAEDGKKSKLHGERSRVYYGFKNYRKDTDLGFFVAVRSCRWDFQSKDLRPAYMDISSTEKPPSGCPALSNMAAGLL